MNGFALEISEIISVADALSSLVLGDGGSQIEESGLYLETAVLPLHRFLRVSSCGSSIQIIEAVATNGHMPPSDIVY
ncbi:hypothetical protein CCR75_001335 [Bremia lactucae]|uniref:Uncharacterized protein n=1 Tax=Bremia lactucae TaxID=4779 RepID=A0A976FGC6_BRELC|nr:hypothetical protein CCR75_001335 [Bremia lactucae]